MGSKKNNRSGLTVKQQKFADNFLGRFRSECHGHASNSYKQAYDVYNEEGRQTMSDNAIRVEASKLLDNALITQYILSAKKKEEERIEEKNSLQADALRQRVTELLLLEATTCNSDSARVTAIQALGKLKNVEAFGSDKVETTNTTKITYEESLEELQQAIADSLDDSNVIDLFNKKD